MVSPILDLLVVFAIDLFAAEIVGGVENGFRFGKAINEPAGQHPYRTVLDPRLLNAFLEPNKDNHAPPHNVRVNPLLAQKTVKRVKYQRKFSFKFFCAKTFDFLNFIFSIEKVMYMYTYCSS